MSIIVKEKIPNIGIIVVTNLLFKIASSYYKRRLKLMKMVKGEKRRTS